MFLVYMTSVIENQNQKLDKKALDLCLNQMAKGDISALEEFYERTDTAIFSYALSIVKNPTDAEDILQNSFIKIYQSSASYQSAGKPMAWILTIVKNEAFKLLNRQKKFVDFKEVKESSTDDFAEFLEQNLILKNCFSILTEEERNILILHILTGFKHREIAAELQLPLSTVLSKYHRALKKLKETLTKEMDIQ